MTTDTTEAAPRNRRIAPLWRAILVATVLLLGVTASASAAPNPATNIPAGPLPHACAVAPKTSICIDAVVQALDKARAHIGLGPYLLPADFDALPGDEQLLILSNLDRLAYGLPAINGLSPALSAVAAVGVTNDADPDPSALLTGLSTFGWSSNWAGAFGNAPEAYYAWMYYDGWGGKQTSNLDCTSPTASGCWGHRLDVLAFAQQGTLTMGAAVTRDAHGQLGYAMTLVWTPASPWTSFTYTWAQAQADGAGSLNRRQLATRRPQVALVRAAKHSRS
jgi:hypothetical protein